MTQQVDLILIGAITDEPFWPLGKILRADATPQSVQSVVENHLQHTEAEAWIFWDSCFATPGMQSVLSALNGKGDVWHAGLTLGMRGTPGLIDFVHPTWMFTRDPEPTIEATSWRLSLRACLIRTSVLRALGGPQPEFESLEGAALELGHRLITRGASVRHTPELLGNVESEFAIELPIIDEIRFLYYRFGSFWTKIALARAAFTGYAKAGELFRGGRQVLRSKRPAFKAPFEPAHAHDGVSSATATVTVLLPTLDRYPYLRTLLSQLRIQSIPPYEIIIIDQTPEDRRDTLISADFADLPLKMVYRDKPGQCTSRNAGLRMAGGDYILFIDDDDEVPSTLIEEHLRNISLFQADVSSGIANEPGAEIISQSSRFIRQSDGFPTNNTMARREAFHGSGLFDLAYERGSRADGDLGMRLYLSGAQMVLNPDIQVLHHHAPSGGLRTHRARVITYGVSRNSITKRQLPSATEIYLAKRYFSERQVRELLWQGLLGTFSIRGSRSKKLLKVAFGLIVAPNTLWRIRENRRRAEQMLQTFPEIPNLVETPPQMMDARCI